MGWNYQTKNWFKLPSSHAFLIGARSEKIIGLITLSKISRVCNNVENIPKISNDKNNNNRISFDELLINRRFSSYIYKYDNVYGDREIRDYIRQRDNESYAQWQTRIVMESERIKKEILDFEIDMWGY